MSRVFRHKNTLLCGILPNLATNEVDFNKFKEARGLYIEDPWERVASIFSKDEMGDFHPEMKYMIDMIQIGLFAGAVYGGVIESYKSTDNFLRTNDTNIYMNKSHMYKVLSNENIKGLLKGSVKYAPKFAFFCGGFVLISSCCEAYRNKPSVIDNGIAGFSVGALSRFSLGLKGMLSGGIVGGVLGLTCGFLKWMRYKFTDKESLELKYAHFAYSRHRERLRKGISEPEIETDSETKVLNMPRTLDNFEVLEDESEKAQK